ncbi:MAG: hypothetical protein LBS11_03000 [Oscillospiraceae bacterium]|jgi:hypothetical protein|nr:hypothetical protein [Oscillospiraceae bacterium]
MTAEPFAPRCLDSQCPPEVPDLLLRIFDGFAALHNGMASYLYALDSALSCGLAFSASADDTLLLNNLARDAASPMAGMASSVSGSICCLTQYITDV